MIMSLAVAEARTRKWERKQPKHIHINVKIPKNHPKGQPIKIPIGAILSQALNINKDAGTHK